MLTIWGRPTAFNAQKVVWAAEEVGIPYERIDAGTKWGVVDTPEYRRLNPNGLVPVIQDGDYVLWESNTIVRYLSGKYGKNDLYPADFLTRIEAERWMDWQATHVLPAHKAAFQYAVRNIGTLEQAQASFEQTNALFAILDAALATKPYVAGNHFTMGDIPIGSLAYRWYSMDWAAIPRMPHLQDWYARVTARPSFDAIRRLPKDGQRVA